VAGSDAGHRIADPRVLRLIERWLKAGILESGRWEPVEVGTPQGSGISPGSAFGVSAHFPKGQVRIEGPSKVYVRASDLGAKSRISFLPRLRHLGVLVCGGPPGPYRHRFWHVRRPVDALADGIDLGDYAASVGDLRSPGRSVYRPIIDTGNTRNRWMRTPTVSDDV